MASRCQWSTLVHALCLSLAAVAGTTGIQGSLLFRRDLAAVSNQWPCSIGQVSISGDCTSAVVMFTVAPPLGGAHRHIVGVYDLTAKEPVFAAHFPQLHPWRAIAAPGGPHAFISTVEGGLYSLDLTSRTAEPAFLGQHDLGHADFVECSPDGSIVVVGCRNVTIAWHRESKRLLWRRTDLIGLCGAILANPLRLVCGTEAGEELEIDLASGVTLRTIATRECPPFSVAISPCGRYLASLDYARHLVVTDLDGCRILWSCRCQELVGPRFSPDGKMLIAAYSSPGEQLAAYCTLTGRKLGQWSGAAEPIKGLAVPADGSIYAWDVEAGIITALDFATGSVVFRLFPERDWSRRG